MVENLEEVKMIGASEDAYELEMDDEKGLVCFQYYFECLEKEELEEET